jgi:hypothetical protein
MLKLGLHKKRQPITAEPNEDDLQSIFDFIDKSNAISGNAIQRLTDINSTVLDECLQILVNKKWIEVAYEKMGLDGITRSYYRVSETYNLLDAREKVSRFITVIIRKAKPLVDNGSHYSVRVPMHKGFNMVFDTRKNARDYKRLLKESRMKLNAEIWEQIFEDGIQIEERKIS